MTHRPTYEELKKRVQELEQRESEQSRMLEDFSQIFSMSLDMICIADIYTATFIRINPAFTETLGYTEEELLGKPFLDFIHPNDVDVTRGVIDKKLRIGAKVINFENRYQCKHGGYRWLSWVSHPNLKKGVTYSVARDITEWKQNEEGLKKSKALLDATGRMARVGGWELDAETLEVTWTDETYRIHEVPLGQKPSLQKAINFFNPEDRPKLEQAIQRALDQGEPYDLEIRFITAQGNHLWTRTKCEPEVVDGKIVVLKGTFQDITDRKTAEDAFRKSEERLLLVIKGSNDAPWDWNLINNELYYSPQWWGQLGYTPDELPADAALWERLMHPEDSKHVDSVFGIALQNGTDSYEVEFRLLHKEGHYVPVLSRGFITRDETGKPIRVTGTNMDLTQQKQTEQLLRKNENKLRDTIDATPFPVAVVDLKDDKIFYWSTSAHELFGHTAPTASEWYQIAYPDPNYRQDVIERWKFFLEIARTSGCPVNTGEYRITCKDGTERICELYATFLPDNFIVTFNDITQRKKMEKALKERTDFLDKIIESAALSTWISDEKGTAIRANPACLEFFGATEDEVIGKYNLLKDIVIEKSGFMPRIRDVFEKAKTANIVIDYDLSEVNHVNVKKATHKTMNSIFTPIKDATGKVSNVIVQTIDLTDIKKMENELMQSRKMESIGNLAGGIAHEFNNILSIIIGNNELVMEDLPDWSLARESTEEIRIAGMRARDVVKQLLTFSRQDNSIKKVINIRSVVNEAMKLIRSSTPTNIEIQQALSDDVYTILGNATQMNQMLINLCNNAVDALPSIGGLLAVDLSNETVDEKLVKSHPKLKPGQYVKLVVRDNGIGMDKETLDKVFDPYFTTKEIGKGTGIGLAVVHGIVERHDGAIIADSRPDQGTTFTVFLPIHEGLPEDESDERTVLPTGNERILYVDDEPALAKLGKRHLESLGYTAESTTDPLKALEMVKKDPDKFDLVISDMAMPKMTGDQLLFEIFRLRSDIPTIICTGYSAKISEKEAVKIGVRSFVMKPLNKAELAKTIRKVLDEVNF